MKLLYLIMLLRRISSLNSIVRYRCSSNSAFISQYCTRSLQGHSTNAKTVSSALHSTSTPISIGGSNFVDFYTVNSDDNTIQYGDYALIASQSESTRQYATVSTLGTQSETVASSVGKKIWLRGRVATVRAKGNACFLVLRSQSFYTVQCCHFKSKDPTQADVSKELIKFAGALTGETIVDVLGVLVPAEVKACTQATVEVQIEKLFVVSRAPTQLPFLLADAARTQAEIDSSQDTERPFPNVPQDLRLNSRWLDLRVPANNAIMRLKSAVGLLFREALISEGFVEIQSPKLIAGESEGGAEVFRTDYFGQPACLAQSPQLYKQMAISADLGRVFEIGPVFRAENSKTRRHLCEFTGLDLEMEVTAHYGETLGVLHGLFRHIFEGLEIRFAKELAMVREQYPSEPVLFTESPLVLHWGDAMDLLAQAGQPADPGADLTGASELLLGKIVREKYGADFFALDQYPSAVRPFYTMPNPQNPLSSNSYDLFLRGQEICSGAQRCHDPDLLEARIREKGMDPSTSGLQSYIESFRHGVSPHAGAGIGLERVVFLYLGLDNIRKASLFPRDPTRLTP